MFLINKGYRRRGGRKEWVMKTFVSYEAVSGQKLFERAADSLDELAARLDALRAAQQQWAGLPESRRTEGLRALTRLLGDRKAEFAQAVCREVGRTLRECEAEIDKTLMLLDYYAVLAPKLLQPKPIATQAAHSEVRFEPLGVVFAVMPWNYPVWQVLRFAVPALCAGNACWFKPAPSVGLVSQMLHECAQEAGLPLQAAWAAHSDVETLISYSDGLAFTGSSATGRHLAALAGRHLKKTVLELGGSNAFIVLDDADLAIAAADAAYARFRDAGQSCNAAKRIIVTEQIADEFTALFLKECSAWRCGAPWHPETTLAPLHAPAVLETLEAQIADALAHGAHCLLGGVCADKEARYFPATVMSAISPQCRMFHEEVFGPVAALYRVPDARAAVNLANATPFGLGASIYSADTEGAWALAAQLQAGSVYINRHTSSDVRMPFGGVKDSGFGRELSEFGLYEFVNVKTYWQK